MENLEKYFSFEEAKYVIFKMDKDKSSGLDGFSMLFFLECWDSIKEDIMKVFGGFYVRGEMSKVTKYIFIVLIPI